MSSDSCYSTKSWPTNSPEVALFIGVTYLEAVFLRRQLYRHSLYLVHHWPVDPGRKEHIKWPSKAFGLPTLDSAGAVGMVPLQCGASLL